jgi:hypothetical protein
MDQPVLSDKNIFPDEEVIFSHIGKSKTFWLSLFGFIHEKYPDFSEEWRYYMDGKSWLMKITRKGKTIFWLSVVENSFRITFYFTSKAEELINNSSISEELKKQFSGGKTFNKIRGITILFKKNKDVSDAKTLISIKLNLK